MISLGTAAVSLNKDSTILIIEKVNERSVQLWTEIWYDEDLDSNYLDGLRERGYKIEMKKLWLSNNPVQLEFQFEG